MYIIPFPPKNVRETAVSVFFLQCRQKFFVSSPFLIPHVLPTYLRGIYNSQYYFQPTCTLSTDLRSRKNSNLYYSCLYRYRSAISCFTYIFLYFIERDVRISGYSRLHMTAFISIPAQAHGHIPKTHCIRRRVL